MSLECKPEIPVARRLKRQVFNPWVGEDAREKELATHSSILAWEIPWTEEPGRLHTVHGVAKQLDMTEQLYNNNNRENSLGCSQYDLQL